MFTFSNLFTFFLIYFYFDFIFRAIEYYQQTGQTLSAKLKEQREQPGGNRLGGPLRYPHTILFWLRCNQVRTGIDCNTITIL